MKKYKFEIIIFIVNAVYMILELIASRLLSPYFGSSSIVWTSVIGIIMLSSSIGNYIGGIIADKEKLKRNVKYILMISGISVLIIPIMQASVLTWLTNITNNIKIGAVTATIILFFIPSMLVGFLSPIIIKLKMEDLKTAGKTSGKIYAIATLGCIVGNFLGGFYFIPRFGSNEVLFVLAILLFVLNVFVNEENKKFINKFFITTIIFCIISCSLFVLYSYANEKMGDKILGKETGYYVSYDTEYGRVLIYNFEHEGELVRNMLIDGGNESLTFVDEDKCYELFSDYTKFYDLMFEAEREVDDVLMIGGAGFSYPKYYISNFENKNMDVVEIDGKVIELAKKYFYLDKLIEEYDLEENKRLNIIEEDGRVYLNQNTKKYDAILNDAFSGETPAETLTTIEVAKKIYNSLEEDGVYLSNIISSIEGEDSKFLKAEVKTLKEVFENVYIFPCSEPDKLDVKQNCMVLATDTDLEIEGAIELEVTEEDIVLTDNYNPVDMLIS